MSIFRFRGQLAIFKQTRMDLVNLAFDISRFNLAAIDLEESHVKIYIGVRKVISFFDTSVAN